MHTYIYIHIYTYIYTQAPSLSHHLDLALSLASLPFCRSYGKRHPGGTKILTNLINKMGRNHDCTASFSKFHYPSGNGVKWMRDMYIGPAEKKITNLRKWCPVQFTTHVDLHACCGTGWRRLIGSPKLQIIFHKRATKYRSLLRKTTYKDKGSYESSPPCTVHHGMRSIKL